MRPLNFLLLLALASLSSAYQGRRSLAVKAVPAKCTKPWNCINRIKTKVNTTQKGFFVDSHNYYRSLAARAGNPVGNLTWNADLAAYAQDWIEFLRGGACNDTLENLKSGLVGNISSGIAGSNKTIYVRNGTVVDVGENIFFAQITQYQKASKNRYFGKDWPRRVTEFWHNERKNYDFVNRNCTATPCEDYLQLMWNTTRLFGCGFNDCKIAFNQAGIPRANVTLRLVSCNYYPPGVYEGINPF